MTPTIHRPCEADASAVSISGPTLDAVEEAAARLAARMAGREFATLEHHLAAIGELMEMHAERENKHLRRHLVILLERFGQVHDGLVDCQRTSRSPDDYIASMGSILEDERRDLTRPPGIRTSESRAQRQRKEAWDG